MQFPLRLTWALPLLALTGCQSGEDDDVTPPASPTPTPDVSPTPSTPDVSPTPTPIPAPALESICGWDGEPDAGPFQDWWQDGVFYEIFVRSFQDSNDDGVGDFKGLTSRLDYLNDGDPNTTTDLGITGIWLMPIFNSPSDHGYDVTDYRTINPDYGTEADFQEFLDAAHARGIKVILDMVFNHTGSGHPWFKAATSSTQSDTFDWYVWQTTRKNDDWYYNSITGLYYYAAFYGGMPDLNYFNPDVQTEMADIYAYWLDKGVDGYRLDGVKYLAEYNGETENSEATHCYLQGMRRWFDAHYPDRMVVGEVWDSVDVIAPYFGDGQDELALAFDFGVSDGIYDAIIRHDASLLQVPFANREYYYPADGSYGAPFLRNHDMDRTGSVFTEPGQLELAAAIQLALNGTPFIYYGEELGMSGKRGSENNDNNRRSPMQWSPAPGGGFTCETCTPWFPLQSDYQTRNLETEEADPAGLIHWYRRLIEVRLAADNESLHRGDYTRVAATGSGAFAFLRGSGEGAVLVLINLNATALDGATFDLSKVGSWESGVDLLADEGEPASYSGLTGSFSAGTIPAYGIRWLRLSGYTAPNL